MKLVFLVIAAALGGVALLGAVFVIVAALNPPKEYKGAK